MLWQCLCFSKRFLNCGKEKKNSIFLIGPSLLKFAGTTGTHCWAKCNQSTLPETFRQCEVCTELKGIMMNPPMCWPGRLSWLKIKLTFDLLNNLDVTKQYLTCRLWHKCECMIYRTVKSLWFYFAQRSIFSLWWLIFHQNKPKIIIFFLSCSFHWQLRTLKWMHTKNTAGYYMYHFIC